MDWQAMAGRPCSGFNCTGEGVEHICAACVARLARAEIDQLRGERDEARAEVARLRSENERLRAAGEVMWDAATDKVPDSSRLEWAAESWSDAADRGRSS